MSSHTLSTLSCGNGNSKILYPLLYEKQIHKDSTNSSTISVPKEKLNQSSRLSVTLITQVPSTTSSKSLRGLFYVLSSLHETTSWKQLSNTKSIEVLGETPLSCVKEQDLQTQVLFCTVNVLSPDLAITAVLGPWGIYNHSKGQGHWLRMGTCCTIIYPWMKRKYKQMNCLNWPS